MKNISILVMSLLIAIGSSTAYSQGNSDYEQFSLVMEENLKKLDERIKQLNTHLKEKNEITINKFEVERNSISEDLDELRFKREQDYMEFKKDINNDYERLNLDVEDHF